MGPSRVTGFQTFQLQYPYLGSQWGGGVVATYNHYSTAQDQAFLTLFYADDEGLSQTYLYENSAHYSFSLKVQPSSVIGNNVLLGAALGVRQEDARLDGIEGISLVIFEVSSQTGDYQKPKRMGTPLVQLLYNDEDWSNYFVDPSSPMYVEKHNLTGVYSSLLDSASGAAIIDFYPAQNPASNFNQTASVTGNTCNYFTQNPECKYCRLAGWRPKIHLDELCHCYY
jgi:hypothetical protein